MDKKIKRLQKDTKKLAKEESALLKADKKRDKVCKMGEKMMAKKKEEMNEWLKERFEAEERYVLIQTQGAKASMWKKILDDLRADYENRKDTPGYFSYKKFIVEALFRHAE